MATWDTCHFTILKIILTILKIACSQGAEESVREMISIPQPRLVQHFHDAAGVIDQHNRTQQSDLGVETSFHTHDWDKMVVSSALAVAAVNTFIIAKAAVLKFAILSLDDFFCALGTELCSNSFSFRVLRNRAARTIVPPPVENFPASGSGLRLTPTRTLERPGDPSRAL